MRDSENKLQISEEIYEYIPFAYVPLPRKRNPVLVLRSDNSVIIRLLVYPYRTSKLKLNGTFTDDLVNLTAAFLNQIKEVTGFEGSVNAYIYSVKSVVDSFAYVALTNELLKLLGGHLDKELISSARTIDAQIGADDSILALRDYVFHKGPYIWRRGEESVELSDYDNLSISYEVLQEVDMKYLEPIEYDLITRLSGLATIDIARNLRNKKVLKKGLRAINSMWHLVYGVPLPEDNNELNVIVKGLGHAYLIHVTIEG